MKERTYHPEGGLIGSAENNAYLSSVRMLERAMNEEVILEGTASACVGPELDLVVDLGGIRGVIPRREAALDTGGGAKDIAIITRVARPVAFTVTDIKNEGGEVTAYLSRRRAQYLCREEYISTLSPGDIVDAAVTHLDPFGAFVDIGCGIISLLGVDCISVSRISHPSERLKKGQTIKTVIKSIDESGRIYVTLRELLGTWEENAAAFEAGSTVAGIVRSVEDYGIFVELAPNLAGLAERHGGASPGDACAVYIKNIIKEKMKVKLSIIDSYAGPGEPAPFKYFVDTSKVSHISRWRYSPLICPKTIETIF